MGRIRWGNVTIAAVVLLAVGYVLDLKEVQVNRDSAELLEQARLEIENAVIPVLRNSIGTYLKMEGSAGWPQGPASRRQPSIAWPIPSCSA